MLTDPQDLQTVASILLLFVTAIYVFFTWKLVHTPHTAFVQPVKIDFGNYEFNVKVRNFGPGPATNVHVFVRAHTDINWAPTDTMPERAFIQSAWIEASGPVEINKDEMVSYEFDGTVGSNTPIKIRWKLVTGKNRQQVWFAPSAFGGPMNSGWFYSSKYYFLRAIQSIRSPYYAWQRKRYLKKKGARPGVASEP